MLASFTSEFKVYSRKIVFGKTNTDKKTYMRQFLHIYFKYTDKRMTPATFLSVLLNLRRLYNG